MMETGLMSLHRVMVLMASMWLFSHGFWWKVCLFISLASLAPVGRVLLNRSMATTAGSWREPDHSLRSWFCELDHTLSIRR